VVGLPTLDAGNWMLVLIAAACIGVAKAGLGGVAMISILLMAHVFQPRASTGIQLTLLIVGDIFAIVAYRRSVLWPMVWRLFPLTAVGVVIGYFMMPVVPDRWFGALIGWITLVFVAMTTVQLSGIDFIQSAARSRAAGAAAGLAGGITTMLANAAGPVLTIYLLACRLPKMQLVGTAAWLFFFINVFKVPFSASMGLVNGQTVALAVVTTPAVLAGAFAGRWVISRINQWWFERVLILLTLLGALRLIFR
jgi:uncharacterized membrane protein YfcA